MQNTLPSRPTPSKAGDIFHLIGFVLLCYFTGQLMSVLLGEWVFGMKEQAMVTALLQPHRVAAVRNTLIFLQTLAALLSFLLLPAAYLYFFQSINPISYFAPKQKLLPVAVGLCALLIIIIMPVNAVLIEWNKHLQFPDGLHSLENYLQDREQQAAQLTKVFTSFSSIGQLLVGLVFIAIIPAIGEEFFFRGLIQAHLMSLFRNPHVAIVCTGILFSFFHFQLYGFVPRMGQGILLGYVFYWSKNLWYPISAHLINNGFTVLMYYLWQHGKLPVNVTDTSQVPMLLSGTCLLLTLILLFTLKKYFFRQVGMPSTYVTG